MRNIRLTIQYEGTNYFGWQRQRNTSRTIEAVITKTLEKVLHQRISLIGASRTDAGVHAQAQVANFKINNTITVYKLQAALNALLPADIRISKVEDVPLRFNSRYHSLGKTYRYTIVNRSYHDVFSRQHAYLFAIKKLDLTAMRKAAGLICGRHDFAAFKIAGSCGRKTTVRTISKIKITKKKDFIYLDITGGGFLYKMVRSITGTLIDIGRGRLAAQDIINILKSKNRNFAGPTAPACGLCLVKIDY